MRKIASQIIGCIFLLLIFSSFSPAPSQTREVLDKMLKAMSDVKSLKYSLKVIERTAKKVNNFSSSVKFIRHPRKIYLNAKGIEVLWVEGKHDGDALVNPNSFPYINLYLDPSGSLMRQDQHHTLNELGFDYLGGIIAQNAKISGNNFDDCFKLGTDEIVNNRYCWKMTINNFDFTYKNYTVQKGENLIKIARKFFISEYMILENNQPKVDDYKDVKEGQVIKIPTAYAKNVTLYIDKQTCLPVSNRVFDDKGLFEQYDYFNLILNPTFQDAEFTKEYKDYKF